MIPTVKEAFLARLSEDIREYSRLVAFDYFQAFAGFISAAPQSFVTDMGERRMRESCLEQVREAVERGIAAYVCHVAVKLLESKRLDQQHMRLCENCIAQIASVAGVQIGLVTHIDRFVLTRNGEIPLIGEMILGVLTPDVKTINAWARHTGLLEAPQPSPAN